MKNFITLVIFVIAAFLVYNNLMTPLSEEEQRIKSFEEEFQHAVTMTKQAGRTAALGGVDTTSSYEMGVEKAKRVRDRLEEIIEELKEDKAIDRAEELLDKIDAFIKDND